MSYTVRPLSDRTWLRSDDQRHPTRFSAKWVDTEALLLDEVNHLDGTSLVIEVDVREQDLRQNGTLRANAREAATPAVVVAFDSRHGAQLHRCDRFYAPYSFQGPHWQHNVRALALTLQALRAVDRYGGTETGQQYTGFKALPGGTPMPPPDTMSLDEAWSIIGSSGPGNISDQRREFDQGYQAPARAAYRRARAANHPDRRDGDRTLWDQVEQAAQVLGVSS